MKKLSSLLSILFISGFITVIYSQAPKRTAVIIDQSGISTELKSLSISGRSSPAKYFEGHSKLIVNTETFDVLIPFSKLISIEYIGDDTKNKEIFNVSYNWRGELKMISGNLVDKLLKGQSDFGGFSISCNKLKQLIFNHVPDTTNQNDEFHSIGYITLRDGTKLEFGDWIIVSKYSRKKYTLKRQTTYSYKSKKALPQDANDRIRNQTRYEWVTSVKNGFYEDISFERGESQGNTKFNDLKSIEFDGENNRDIILTLKNGKSTNAIIKKSGIRDFVGLVGVSEKNGEFYIERKNIRNVYFY